MIRKWPIVYLTSSNWNFTGIRTLVQCVCEFDKRVIESKKKVKSSPNSSTLFSSKFPVLKVLNKFIIILNEIIQSLISESTFFLVNLSSESKSRIINKWTLQFLLSINFIRFILFCKFFFFYQGVLNRLPNQ